MKEFAAFRTTLQESIEDLEEHSVLQGAMPPNILILRRKTVRLFPGGTMVALYYNDKLDQYFSIPYGGDVETTITPASLKEEPLTENQHKVGDKVLAKLGGVEQQGKITEIHPDYLVVHGAGEHHKISHKGITRNFRVDKSLGWGPHELDEAKKLNSSQLRVQRVAKKQREAAEREDLEDAEAENSHKQMAWKKRRIYEDAPKTSQEKEIERYDKTAALWKNRKQRWSAYKASAPKADLQKEELNEDAISHLTRVKNFETNTSLRHKDGSQTKVDPTTATMLLKVHGALQPDNQQKFAHHLEHSKQQFNKMLDFGWRQVK